jgi:hypothetical protein
MYSIAKDTTKWHIKQAENYLLEIKSKDNSREKY